MSIATTAYSTLNADAGVRAYVGEATSPQHSKIYPLEAAEDVSAPYIVTHIISGTKVDTLSGVGDADHQRIQLDCYHVSYEQAQAMTDAMVSALEGNGKLEFRFDRYDEDTRLHVGVIDWSFIL